MSEKRVQFNTIVASQLPAYVREEYPLIQEFLKSYYLGQEYQGGPIDLIQNIDRYSKLDATTNLSESVILKDDTSFDSTTINVNSTSSPEGTRGFPDSYGLLQIDDEVITYTGKTDYSFTGCIRGFVGITSYTSETDEDEVVFTDSVSADHLAGVSIKNLSVLFLQEFLTKTKHQLLPGLENRKLYSDLNQAIFIKNAKDFYTSKGTNQSFQILFKALYNEDVDIIKPSEYLFTPSNSQYRIVKELVVEAIDGNPEELLNSTVYQEPYEDLLNRAYAPVTSVENISVGYGKTFYKLSFDGGYDRDIRVEGAIYGSFKSDPTTRVIGEVGSGATVLTVDSTVGFGTTGELFIQYNDTTTGVVSYTSKSLRQFYGITDLDNGIADGGVVGINTFAYGLSNTDGENVLFRISSVLHEFVDPGNTLNLTPGGVVNVTTLGISEENEKTRYWLYNDAPVYVVTKLELFDASNNSYKVTINTKPPYVRVGDTMTLTGSDGSSKTSQVKSIQSEHAFIIFGQGALNLDLTYKIQRNIQNVSSNSFPQNNIYTSDVSAVYKKNNDYLVASPSLPHYNGQPIDTDERVVTFSGTFIGEDIEIVPGGEHGYYTGEAVSYKIPLVTQSYINPAGRPDTREVKGTGLFAEGLYFIKRVSGSTVKFARSRNDIYNNKFVEVESAVTITPGNSIEPFKFDSKNIDNQKLLKRIPSSNVDGELHPTVPERTNGIFVNGVELINYKSEDLIRYGEIESIDVLAPGSNIDIINVPSLIIEDAIGTGATGYAAVKGTVTEIRVKQSGFDYVREPTVRISGGNGTGAKANVSMKQIGHKVDFFADVASANVIIGTASTQSIIGFSTYHKFRDAERVLYRTQDQTGVGGISTDSEYYVFNVDSNSIKLHKTESDATAGINTVFLTSFGIGKHSIESFNSKLVVNSINVADGGFGYENKKRTALTSGISTSMNYVTIKNHDYQSGEIVKYDNIGTPVSGLTTNTEYYVIKIDDDNFRLSSDEFGYENGQYVEFGTVGVGTHIFNYPEITVTLNGEVGISSVGTEDFKAVVEPIVRGSVSSIHLEAGGSAYGTADILNFERQPLVSLQKGIDCQLKPLVSNGKIVQVIILNQGTRYFSEPDINIFGDGQGAILTPIVVNGSVTEVRVIDGGVGYNQATTSLNVVPAGTTEVLPEFSSKIQCWRVDRFQKSLPYLKNDDGFVVESLEDKYGLQYGHVYAPRKLRESVYALDQNAKILYGQSDLRKVNNIEVASPNHSPIIGWAYDGCPIYGPYGYSTRSGGVITQMKSGYSVEQKGNRPPTSIYPLGFFVEDYTYNKVTDDNILDENNGRFCITPDYPQGVYAYFTTVGTTAETSGIFKNYKAPVFPYVVGENFKAIPDTFNWQLNNNQDDYNLEENGWRRNTKPLNLMDDDSQYPYLYIPNHLKQTGKVQGTSPGEISSVGILTGGTEYRVGDKLVFDNVGTSGYNVTAKVSKVEGRKVNSVSVASTTVEGLEIFPAGQDSYVLYSENPHKFNDQDVISLSGLSTTSVQIEGTGEVGVTSNRLFVAGIGTTAIAIGDTSVTGLATYFNVRGELSIVRENDIYTIGSERVKILNVDPGASRIRVLREVDGTVGTSHTVGQRLQEDPRRLFISPGFIKDQEYYVNGEFYFDPAETVATGTAVGVGTTVVFSNPGVGPTSVFLPSKSVYLPSHGLATGDRLTYSANGGAGIIVEDETNVGVGTTLADGTELFVAKLSEDLIGIATVRVGLGTTGTFVGIATTCSVSTTLFFRNVGAGDTHSFTTNYSAITGNLKRNLVTVGLAATHGLHPTHSVTMKVNPQSTVSYSIKYNDSTRKLVVDHSHFSFTAAGVNTTTNEITIPNHGFSTGDKVVHTATLPSAGLSSNTVYYAVRVDENRLGLSTTSYDSRLVNPITVGITSASAGTLNPVNPVINVVKNSTVEFDLSDSSLAYVRQGQQYPAFEFNLYSDNNFTQRWYKSDSSKNFEFSTTGTVGTAGAKATLTVNKDIPEVLFYKLDPIYESDLPVYKEEIVVDNEVTAYNQIVVGNSAYSGTFEFVSTSTTSFTYSLPDKPEADVYTTPDAEITYDTICPNTYGAISQIEVTDGGRNYYSLPGITTITSIAGSGAILEVKSNNIGQLKRVAIDDIGYNFAADTTLNPSILYPQVVRIDPLASFKSIEVTSKGKGFLVPLDPLVVVDGKTNEVVTDVDLRMDLTVPEVTILQNTNGMSNTPPTIIPVNSGAGVGISTIEFDSTTKETIVTMAVGFSTVNSFPFETGDKVFIENVSVGVGSTGKGYNSSDYNYKFFTITDVQENLGGIGSVTYSLDGDLTAGEFPGTFDAINSTGRIIAQKNFPLFDVQLETRDYTPGETVKSDSATGIVDSWDPKASIVRISSDEYFATGEIIEGVTSEVQGVATSVTRYDSYAELQSLSNVIKGSQNTSGFLSAESQRIQDSYYYQNFSYSLKSRVPYDTWNDAVSSLNHTAGFKKFADYQLESTTNTNSSPGLTTDTSYFTIVSDMVSIGSLNCYYDFDIVTENNMNQNGRTVSDEIVFGNRVLTDYFESVSNRVLQIDDISDQFNSNPREEEFVNVSEFNLNEGRFQKVIALVQDKRFTSQKTAVLVDLLHDNSQAYINSYGRVETVYDQGSFDFVISGTDGVLQFYPVNATVNDYDIDLLTTSLQDGVGGIGNTSLGGVTLVGTSSTDVTAGTTHNIVSIANTYRSAKVLVQINADTSQIGDYEAIELTVLNDGTDVHLLEYGRLTTGAGVFPLTGLGTYHAYLDGSTIKVDFISEAVGIATTGALNTIFFANSDSTTTGIGTIELDRAKLEGRTTTISASGTPGITTVMQNVDKYDASYIFAQVEDTTNSRYQVSELMMVDNWNVDDQTGDTFLTEYAPLETHTGLGTFGAMVDTNGLTSLVFTPLAGIDVSINLYVNSLTTNESLTNINTIGFETDNGSIKTDSGIYLGTQKDIKRAFGLKHKDLDVFERYFEGNDSTVVDITNNTITIPNHFFVTGEQIEYKHAGVTAESIGIATASFVGAADTTFLPSENLYVVKLSDNTIKLATSAANALNVIPQTVDLTTVGVATNHKFVAIKQNQRVVVAIDNIIQSPVVATAVTSSLVNTITSEEIVLELVGISSIFGGDLLRVENEIMKVDAVGVGSTNFVTVSRPWMGTTAVIHSAGTLVTKVSGNYNIVDNTLNFITAPYGNTPIGTTSNPPDEQDWTGITTSSKFQGRSFMRSAAVNSTSEPYYQNYVFDDISNQFNGTTHEFDLKVDQSDVAGISSSNGVVLINGIFQTPGQEEQYVFNENTGVTSIEFKGTSTTLGYDVGVSSFPRGGTIVSVGSTEGFGYQPLVSAGGTAVVSGLGTISSISIGNSGSGYRSGVSTIFVGVRTTSDNLEIIGQAVISDGNVTDITITNPGSGYTTTNVPEVVIDAPISYSNIPLVYSSASATGVGTFGFIDIVVGQGSSVIDFEITNTGYAYKNGDILTVGIGGTVGIPTTSSFSGNEFQVTIDRVAIDKFTGWTLGNLQLIDNVEPFIDGSRVDFQLKIDNIVTSIVAGKGSKVTVQDNLLIFINDILQVPGESYSFTGGSIVTFSEAPKLGDTIDILFYKGSGDGIDVIFRDVIETVKKGDTLQISHDPTIGQPSRFSEEERVVTLVPTIDVAETNIYNGPGNVADPTYERPVKWCKQTEDKFINGIGVGKDRELYEPVVIPTAYLIKSVGVGSTAVYVDNVKTLFDPYQEDLGVNNLKVNFISSSDAVGASATAVVSGLGSVTSIELSNIGSGYASAPTVIIGSVGVGSTATATATVGAGGTLSISITSNGIGYTNTNPPQVIIEQPTGKTESTTAVSYAGDCGKIVGFGTTTVGSDDVVIFDLFTDPSLRDEDLVGPGAGITISGISAGDYFVVYDSNITGAGVTALDDVGNTVGVGTTFADNVYFVESVSTVSIANTFIGLDTVGTAVTDVKRVQAIVTGMTTVTGISTSKFYGNYSWGRVDLSARSSLLTFDAHTLTGSAGINTSDVLTRTQRLKFDNYLP